MLADKIQRHLMPHPNEREGVIIHPPAQRKNRASLPVDVLPPLVAAALRPFLQPVTLLDREDADTASVALEDDWNHLGALRIALKMGEQFPDALQECDISHQAAVFLGDCFNELSIDRRVALAAAKLCQAEGIVFSLFKPLVDGILWGQKVEDILSLAQILWQSQDPKNLVLAATSLSHGIELEERTLTSNTVEANRLLYAIAKHMQQTEVQAQVSNSFGALLNGVRKVALPAAVAVLLDDISPWLEPAKEVLKHMLSEQLSLIATDDLLRLAPDFPGLPHTALLTGRKINLKLAAYLMQTEGETGRDKIKQVLAAVQNDSVRGQILTGNNSFDKAMTMTTLYLALGEYKEAIGCLTRVGTESDPDYFHRAQKLLCSSGNPTIFLASLKEMPGWPRQMYGTFKDHLTYCEAFMNGYGLSPTFPPRA